MVRTRRGRPAATQVWVSDAGAQQLVEVDAGSAKVVLKVPLASTPTALAGDRNALWAAQPLETATGTLARIEPASGRTTTIPVGTGDVADLFARAAPYALAVNGQTVWTNTEHARLVRVVGGRRTDFDLGRGHSIDAIAVGAGSIWIASSADDTVLRVDPRSGRLATRPIRLGTATGVRAGPAAIAYGEGSVWVAAALASRVIRIDPSSGRAVASIPVPARPTGIAVGAGAVWVLSAAGSVTRIDPEHDRVDARIPVGRQATAIAAGADRVWVTVAGGRAAGAGPPPLPARPLVAGSCGPLQAGGAAPDLIVVSDLPSFQNGDQDNPNVVDMRRAILAVLQGRGFRAGPYGSDCSSAPTRVPARAPTCPCARRTPGQTRATRASSG